MHGDKLNITSLAVAICTLIPAVSTADDSVAEALEQSGVHGGLVVVVGCEAPDVLTDLSRRGPYLVHGLDTRQGRVERAREQILGQGLVGRVSVSTWDGKRLPFVDNVVNLVLVQDSTVSLEEIDCRRVLAPGGWVAARHAADSDLGFDRMGDWFVYHEAMPEALDSWGHHMYDSSGIGAGNDRTVGPPRHLQWKAGPEFSRSHENMSSVSVVVSAGGRVYSIMDEGPLASIYLPSQWYLKCRDAFSGVLLWTRPIESWHARLFPLKSGPVQLTRRLVATDQHVYVTLGLDAPVSKVDATTGKILATYETAPHTEEILHVDGKLILVFDPMPRPGDGKFALGEAARHQERKDDDLS